LVGKFAIWTLWALLVWVAGHLVLGTFSVRRMAGKVDFLSDNPGKSSEVFLHDTYIKSWPGLSMTFTPRPWAAILVASGLFLVAVGLAFLLHVPCSVRD
jgi:hypothetical protein